MEVRAAEMKAVKLRATENMGNMLRATESSATEVKTTEVRGHKLSSEKHCGVCLCTSQASFHLHSAAHQYCAQGSCWYNLRI